MLIKKPLGYLFENKIVYLYDTAALLITPKALITNNPAARLPKTKAK